MRIYYVLTAALTAFSLIIGSGAMADGVGEPSEGAPLTSLAIDPELKPLALYDKTYEEEVYDGDTLLVQGRRVELCLGDWIDGPLWGEKTLPSLADALTRQNQRENAAALKASQEITEQARTDAKERETNYFPYKVSNGLSVRRADNLALSYLLTQYQYSGGAHGYFGVQGVNLDATTGKALRLSEVMEVSDYLTQVIIEKLQTKYNPKGFYENMPELVAKEVASESIVWSLGARGVTFYFNSYDIAPYASGMLTVTIFFDERPGFFKQKYLRGMADYAEYLLPGQAAAVYLNDNPGGQGSELMADGEAGKMIIVLDGNHYEEEVGLKDIVPIFVHRADGANFLYADGKNSQGEGEILIYDLAEKKPRFIGRVTRTFGQPDFSAAPGFTCHWLMTSPNYFRVNEFTPRDSKILAARVAESGNMEIEVAEKTAGQTFR